MIEKENYILDEGFLGTKSLFTKQNKFSFSLFLDKNEETRKSFKELEKILKEENVTVKRLYTPNVYHITRVIDIDELPEDNFKSADYDGIRLSTTGDKSDAIITRDLSKTLTVMPGDCIVIALIDEKAGIKGILHAGWKGLIDGIIVNTIEMFKEKGANVNNIKGILFPSVSMNCYDLEEDIIVGFRKFAKELGLNEEEIISYNPEKDRYNIDLRKLALTQIKKLGLKDDNMKTMEYCTYSNKDEKGNYKFHSHRRDRTLSMNMALFLGKGKGKEK